MGSTTPRFPTILPIVEVRYTSFLLMSRGKPGRHCSSTISLIPPEVRFRQKVVAVQVSHPQPRLLTMTRHRRHQVRHRVRRLMMIPHGRHQVWHQVGRLMMTPQGWYQVRHQVGRLMMILHGRHQVRHQVGRLMMTPHDRHQARCEVRRMTMTQHRRHQVRYPQVGHQVRLFTLVSRGV